MQVMWNAEDLAGLELSSGKSYQDMVMSDAPPQYDHEAAQNQEYSDESAEAADGVEGNAGMPLNEIGDQKLGAKDQLGDRNPWHSRVSNMTAGRHPVEEMQQPSSETMAHAGPTYPIHRNIRGPIFPHDDSYAEEAELAQHFYLNEQVSQQDLAQDEEARRWYQQNPHQNQQPQPIQQNQQNQQMMSDPRNQHPQQDQQQPEAPPPRRIIHLDFQEYKAEMHTHQSQLKEKEDLIKNYEAQLNTLKNQVKSMQEGKFKSVEAAVWAPESASDIERKLKNLQSGIKQWSEKFSKLELEQVVGTTQWNKLWRLLLDKDCISSSRMLRERLLNDRAMQKTGRASSLLLSASVSSDILRFIVGDPWFAFVGNERKANILQTAEGDGLQTIIERIGPSDESGAHAVRCQILRLLDPPIHVTGKAADRNRKIAADSRNKAADSLARDCLGDFVGILVPQVSTRDARTAPRASLETFVALKKITLEAAEISWSLWTRKQQIRVLGFRDLVPSGHPNARLIYSSSFEALEAHPLHTAWLEDDPECLNGSPVVLLSSPAVQASGTADGTGYDTARLWKKAVVWMGSGQPAQGQVRSG